MARPVEVRQGKVWLAAVGRGMVRSGSVGCGLVWCGLVRFGEVL